MTTENVDKDQRRAEIFDALSHPTRILILKALSSEPQGFADLKKMLGIESSGHLQHHLNKLGDLVKTDVYGKYVLSDEGKDALLSVETVERVANPPLVKTEKPKRSKKNLGYKVAVAALVAVLAISLLVVVVQNMELNSDVTSLKSDLNRKSLLQAFNQMNTALAYSQALLGIQKPQLQNLTALDGTPTKLALVNTEAGYYYGPNPWPFNATVREALSVQTDNGTVLLPDFGWASAPGNYSWMLHSGQPYISIGVTVENGYTSADVNSQNPPIGELQGVYLSYVGLTVQLYRQDGTQIPADLLNFTSNTNGKFILESNQTQQIVFYLAPSSLDIARYEIYVSSVTPFPP
jgi:DNA-binding HxlR family transcriptional regulator